MTVTALDIATLPVRLTTTEVCTLGRWSVRQFQRRRQSGKFPVDPCDRGPNGELTFPRDAVLRALDLIPDAPAQETPPPAAVVDHDAIRARIAAQRRAKPRK